MTVSFVKTIPGWSGSAPAVSGSYTPGAANNTLINFPVCTGGSSLTYTESSSAGGNFATETSIGTSLPSTAAMLALLACAAGAQTFSLSDNTSNYDISVIGAEYSGVGSLSNASSTPNASPGTGANAIQGTPVVVPAGSVLLACFLESSSSETITPTAGTSRSSSAFNPSYNLVEYAGTGASITPQAGTSANSTLNYLVLQVIMTPPASGPVLQESSLSSMNLGPC